MVDMVVARKDLKATLERTLRWFERGREPERATGTAFDDVEIPRDRLTDYERDCCARLVAARRFGVVLGLDRMRALLDRLGAPDRRLGTVVHVGGTNGKGSTVAMIAALARAAGARVATYTSPHLSCAARARRDRRCDDRRGRDRARRRGA